MKNGFTLIEILVALVIVGILVGTAAVSLGAGVKSAQMADAARAVQQYAGHARAIALLKQRPVVLTITEIAEDGTFVKSRLSTSYGKDAEAEGAGASGGAGFGVAGAAAGRVLTLSGMPVEGAEVGDAPADLADDPLAPEPRDFEGIHIRGQLKEDLEKRRSRISVFSTADLLLRRNREQQEKARAKHEEEGGEPGDGGRTGPRGDVLRRLRAERPLRSLPCEDLEGRRVRRQGHDAGGRPFRPRRGGRGTLT